MGEVPLFRNEPIYKYTKHYFMVGLGYYESAFYKDHQLQKDWGMRVREWAERQHTEL